MSAHVPGCPYDHNLKKFTAMGAGCAAPDQHDVSDVIKSRIASQPKPIAPRSGCDALTDASGRAIGFLCRRGK